MDTAIGLAVIAIAAIWIYRLVERLMWVRYSMSLNGKSNPGKQVFPKADIGSLGYQEQAARVIYDTSVTLSELVVKVDKILKMMEAKDERKQSFVDSIKAVSGGRED